MMYLLLVALGCGVYSMDDTGGADTGIETEPAETAECTSDGPMAMLEAAGVVAAAFDATGLIAWEGTFEAGAITVRVTRQE